MASCPNCRDCGERVMMDPMGYGDEQCPNCGRIYYGDEDWDEEDDNDEENE